jgi:hypothetical protein
MNAPLASNPKKNWEKKNTYIAQNKKKPKPKKKRNKKEEEKKKKSTWLGRAGLGSAGQGGAGQEATARAGCEKRSYGVGFTTSALYG